jgi:hypothetical protein
VIENGADFGLLGFEGYWQDCRASFTCLRIPHHLLTEDHFSPQEQKRCRRHNVRGQPRSNDSSNPVESVFLQVNYIVEYS